MKKRRNINLEAEQLEKIAKLSKMTGANPSAIIRLAIDEYLRNNIVAVHTKNPQQPKREFFMVEQTGPQPERKQDVVWVESGGVPPEPKQEFFTMEIAKPDARTKTVAKRKRRIKKKK